MRRSLIVLAIFLIALMYIVPYGLLSDTRGFELFVFWSIVTVLVGLISLIYLVKEVK